MIDFTWGCAEISAQCNTKNTNAILPIKNCKFFGILITVSQNTYSHKLYERESIEKHGVIRQ
jgi:hypothetical protein